MDLQQREGDLKGQRQVSTLNEIEANFDNIRAAWEQAVRRRNFAAVDAMLDSLYWYCWMRGRFQTGEAMFHLAQEQLKPQDDETPHAVWYRVSARYPRSMDDLKAALRFAREHNLDAEVAFCLNSLGDHTRWAGDVPESIPYYEEALRYYRKTGDQFHIAFVLRSLGVAQGDLGDIEGYIRLHEESLTIQRAIGDRIGEAITLGELAFALLVVGRYEQVEQYGEQALALADETGNRYNGSQGASILAVAIPKMLKPDPDLKRIQGLGEDLLKVAEDYQDAMNKGRALLTLAYVAALEERFEDAERLAKEGQSQMPGDPQQLTLANYLLSYVAACQGRYQDTQAYMVKSIEPLLLFDIREPVRRMIPPAAVVLQHLGQLERAVEVLGLAFPTMDETTEGQRGLPIYAKLQESLKSRLGEAKYQAAWERGRQSDLLTVARELTNLQTG